MDKEYEALQDLADESLVIRKSGIGKVNAAVTASRMIMEHHPDCIISTGVAGGIDPVLGVTDIVVASDVVYHDYFIGIEGEGTELYKPFPCDERLIRIAQTLPVKTGQIASGDQFVQEKEKLMDIKSRHPEALAVDMESGALAHTCSIFGVPFISFRIISDVVGVENHTEHYQNFWQTLTERSFDNVKQFIAKIKTEFK